ncbi:PREDICTED: cytochrome P450 3A19-like, partial [Rhagoletis zephyria]|uniref:cytochrome P450 3A19-like n=1 Tax=Rhagoletis zephyria TaxID=28612 RepID=UPI00081198BD
YLINLTRHIVRERKAECEQGKTTSSSAEAKKRTDLVQLLVDAKADEAEVFAASDKCSSYEHLEAANEDSEKARKTPDPPPNSSVSLTGLSETEIIAQGIFFLTAGFETSSSTLVHALYELARNSSAQARLYDELKVVLESLSSSSRTSAEYFEAVLSRLPYLEAVLKETLRKYAPVQVLLRTTVTDGHRLENGLRLERGQVIEIPVGAVHYSPEYYPEPQEFRPERFLPENAHLLVPYTWLPFGAGARNCVGIRFAMEEMKICLAALLENFEFAPAPNTPNELVFQRGTPVLNSAEFPLRMSKRSH